LIDRSGTRETVLGTVWLLEENRVATCAHVLAMFAGYLDALVVRFIGCGQERGVAAAQFHPRFNHKLTNKLARETITDAEPMLPLQKYNAAVLSLGNLQELSVERRLEISRGLMLPVPQKDQGLSGNLTEIDLSLVIQTITNARKEGTIVISDERNHPVAGIFCRNGMIVYAQYKNLNNEFALYQIVQHRAQRYFIFQAMRQPDWPVDKMIARPTDMLLIEAHRRFDEVEKMVTSMGITRESMFTRAVEQPDFNILSPEVRDCAAILWAFLDGTTPTSQLWQLVNCDDYTIFQSMVEMFNTRQIENVQDGGAYLTVERRAIQSLAHMKMEPMPVAMQVPLSPMDKLASLSVEMKTGRPRLRIGALLGALREGDPFHLVHNIR
ncbi:MAG: DUF4388 domain-containing protein, partial [Terriglobales bacterium]